MKLSAQEVENLSINAKSGIPELEQGITSTEFRDYSINKQFNLIAYKSDTFEAEYIPAKATIGYTERLSYDQVLNVVSQFNAKGFEVSRSSKTNFNSGDFKQNINGQAAGDIASVELVKDCGFYKISIAAAGRRDLSGGFGTTFSVTEGLITSHGSCPISSY